MQQETTFGTIVVALSLAGALTWLGLFGVIGWLDGSLHLLAAKHAQVQRQQHQQQRQSTIEQDIARIDALYHR